MVVALPVELYRSVAQGVDRKGLFRLVKVSRAFQFESERLIYQRITFLFSKQVIQGCRHLLKTPRFWGYIQRLELLHASQEDMHSQWTAGFQQLIGRFLAKLTNLVELSIIAFPGDLKWRSCGTLFRNCRFQLLMLRCSFVLDNHFDSFLKTQRSLITLEWSPGFVSSYRLSPKAAPNLAAIAFHGSQFNAAPWEAFAHCPITHVLWGSPKPERTPLAFVSMASLKAVKIFGPSLEILTALVASSPGLEYLGIIDYTAVEESTFVNEILPFFQNLHIIEVARTGDNHDVIADAITISKLYRACPALCDIGLRAGLFSNRDYRYHRYGDDIESWATTRGTMWMRNDIWYDALLADYPFLPIQ